MVKKQPIIFDDTPADEYVEGEQMMDVMLHYAQSGVFEVERIVKEEPDYFTDQEIQDLVASRTVLSKAPDIIEEYKRKVREFERLQDMVQTVVKKCEDIVEGFEERQAYNTEGKKIKKEPKLDAGMIRYTADGDIIVKKDKKVVIELPKHDEYD